jgi:hypothetical protein
MMKNNTLKLLIILITLVVLPPHKKVVRILSCADSGRCRVEMSDGSLDLLFNPYVGQIVIIKVNLDEIDTNHPIPF